MKLRSHISRKFYDTADVCVIDLVPLDGGSFPSFSAGSHIDVYLPNGIIRQYSLCNSPDEIHRYQIAVLKEPSSRGGSIAVHDLLQEGQLLEISAPRNHFPLADEHKVLLLAAGIGITPIIAMAETLSLSGREFEMHYATRSPERTPFRQRITQGPFASRVKFHFSDSTRLQIDDLLVTPQQDCHLYVCGPKRFIDAVLFRARSIDWPENHLHYELFSAEVNKAEDDERFEIKIASSGQVVTVEKDQTVVQALSSAGIDILISCEQGICGTCVTGVLEGVPDHRDSYLTPEEQAANNQFTPCCSRSKTKQLVIDL